jgi:hypothetical protein
MGCLLFHIPNNNDRLRFYVDEPFSLLNHVLSSSPCPSLPSTLVYITPPKKYPSMPSINKCLVLCALMVCTASALSHNGHIARGNTHNDIAARNAVVDTHLAKKDNVVREAALKRRASNSARCKSRPKSSSSSSHKADPTPAKAVAADPPKDTTTHKKDPPKSSSADKAVATPKKASASSGGSSADAGANALQSFIGGV